MCLVRLFVRLGWDCVTVFVSPQYRRRARCGGRRTAVRVASREKGRLFFFSRHPVAAVTPRARATVLRAFPPLRTLFVPARLGFRHGGAGRPLAAARGDAVAEAHHPAVRPDERPDRAGRGRRGRSLRGRGRGASRDIGLAAQLNRSTRFLSAPARDPGRCARRARAPFPAHGCAVPDALPPLAWVDHDSTSSSRSRSSASRSSRTAAYP